MNDGLLILQVIQLIVSGKCMLLGSVSSQQRFGVTDIKALCVSQFSGLGQTVLQLSGLERTVLQLLDKSVLQLHVTALFYLDNSRKTHPRGVRACLPRRQEEKSAPPCRRERDTTALYLLFLYVFSPPRPALCKVGQPGVFVLPEVLTPVLRSSFVLFCQAFPFLVFQPPPFWIPVSYSNYLTASSELKLQ